MSMKEEVFLLLLLWQAITVTHELCLDVEKPSRHVEQLTPGSARLSSVSEPKQLWNTNTVTVSFINGNCNQRSEVRRVAAEWTPYSNIDFIFIDHPGGDIRVSFGNTLGDWSRVGMDSKGVPGASMHFSHTDRSTILHEFGRTWEHLNFLTQPLQFLIIFKLRCFGIAPRTSKSIWRNTMERNSTIQILRWIAKLLEA